ncbi:MAG TPA: hypothetical protein PLJ47_17175, partial [Candidatus Hydrogenedentes bacterium]|nr:hypothetical protein [Candidatus Hydrogenedentota bacterium]
DISPDAVRIPDEPTVFPSWIWFRGIAALRKGAEMAVLRKHAHFDGRGPDVNTEYHFVHKRFFSVF